MTDYPSASHAAGWYTEMYQSTGGANAALVGIYAGRASQQIRSATGPSMPGIYSSNNTGSPGNKTRASRWTICCGVRMGVVPSGSSQLGDLGEYAGRSAADSAHQPIADDQNSLTGINLSRLYTYQLVYPDPSGGWKWQYLPDSSANQIISQVRNGTSVCGSRSAITRS